MNIQYKQIKTDRYPIRYKVYSPDDSVRGIILGIHGFAGDMESSALEMLASAAGKRGIALLCFDFPAHGSSPTQEDLFTIDNCIKDVLWMADLCRREYPDADKYLFATSFGGFVSLLSSDHLQDFQFVLRAPAVTMPEIFLPDILHTTPEAFEQARVIECGFELEIRLPFSFYVELKRHSIVGQQFDFPILVIHGDEDDVVPHTDIQAFCSNNPKSELVVIPGADHRFKKPGELEQVINAAMKYWGII